MRYRFLPSHGPLFHVLLIFLLLGFLLTLPGCGAYNKFFNSDGNGKAEKVEPEVSFSADALLREGIDSYEHAQYRSALEKFQTLRERYPFSEEGLVAELKSADAHYYLKEYMEALQLYNDFETSHPTNEAIPYVFYQKGMCYFKRIDSIDRDPGAAQEAIGAFSRLVGSYPQSPYCEEAREQISSAREFLARHEMYVVEFYVNTELYPQAIGRLEYILDNYPDTTVAVQAEELRAQLQAGTPPKGKWSDWLPDISWPDWSIFSGTGFGLGSTAE